MAEITIPLHSHDEAVLVLGPYDRYAKLLRNALDIELYARNGNLRLEGEATDIAEARRRIDHLLGKSRKHRELGVREIEEILLGGPAGVTGREPAREAVPGPRPAPAREASHPRGGAAEAPLRSRPIQPRTENQRRYLELIEKHDLTFGVGAAGTGKTFLAVASAVKALRSGACRRLVLTRPVVEAGERLGFLPGDVQAKLDPYMRPLYDSLHALLRYEDVARLEESRVLEIAPLAYMRGRTLSSAFVILDEAQNTTVGQMKMFLTRLGEDSRMVVTGDPSQSDLPEGERSGLNDAIERLRSYEEVGVVEFTSTDVVRHPLVARIVRAYEQPRRREAGGREGGG
ncbi:MAG: PhoH family protein [Planctomycetota bacterium]|nr:PhoH family protein [Planctomycetota bacterium]MDP6761742.1 PhoH family protein [Planctomycetota bacterium]MDP6990947.1 PhoH family protein [Planctomycetota bacterium]